MTKNIFTFVVNFYGTNSYIYKNLNSNFAIIIDPGGEIDEIVDVIKKNNLKIEHYVLTHSHFDHISSLEKIYNSYPAVVIVHEKEFNNVIDNKKNLSAMFGVDGIKDGGKNIKWKKVKDDEKFFCGNQEIKVIHTPGHTVGGICLYIDESSVNKNGDSEKYLFTGDTLFRGTIGRTDFEGGDYNILMMSLKKLASLPKETKIFPGHGQSSVLRYELETNEYFKNII